MAINSSIKAKELFLIFFYMGEFYFLDGFFNVINLCLRLASTFFCDVSNIFTIVAGNFLLNTVAGRLIGESVANRSKTSHNLPCCAENTKHRQVSKTQGKALTRKSGFTTAVLFSLLL